MMIRSSVALIQALVGVVGDCAFSDLFHSCSHPSVMIQRAFASSSIPKADMPSSFQDGQAFRPASIIP